MKRKFAIGAAIASLLVAFVGGAAYADSDTSLGNSTIDVRRVVNEELIPDSTQNPSASAQCPTGYFVVAGSHFIEDVNGPRYNVTSYGVPDDANRRWTATAYNTNSGSPSSLVMTVYATCMKIG